MAWTCLDRICVFGNSALSAAHLVLLVDGRQGEEQDVHCGEGQKRVTESAKTLFSAVPPPKKDHLAFIIISYVLSFLSFFFFLLTVLYVHKMNLSFLSFSNIALSSFGALEGASRRGSYRG